MEAKHRMIERSKDPPLIRTMPMAGRTSSTLPTGPIIGVTLPLQ